MPSEPYVATVSVFQDPPAPYTPREGDVIERGRRRIVAKGKSPMFDLFYVSEYHRSWFDGEWIRLYGSASDMSTHEFAALVNHMGWRLLPRANE